MDELREVQIQDRPMSLWKLTHGTYEWTYGGSDMGYGRIYGGSDTDITGYVHEFVWMVLWLVMVSQKSTTYENLHLGKI